MQELYGYRWSVEHSPNILAYSNNCSITTKIKGNLIFPIPSLLPLREGKELGGDLKRETMNIPDLCHSPTCHMHSTVVDQYIYILSSLSSICMYTVMLLLTVLEIGVSCTHVQLIIWDNKLNDLQDSQLALFYFLQEECMTANEIELKSLKESLQDTQPVGAIVNCCRTLDQVTLWVNCRFNRRHKIISDLYSVHCTWLYTFNSKKYIKSNFVQ